MVCFGSSTSHPPQKHARKKQAAERHLKNSAPMLRRESKVGESLDKHLFIQNCRNWTDNVSCWSNTLAMWGHCLRAGPGDCEALKLRWVYHNRAGGRGVQESATAWYCELSHWLYFLTKIRIKSGDMTTKITEIPKIFRILQMVIYQQIGQPGRNGHNSKKHIIF